MKWLEEARASEELVAAEGTVGKPGEGGKGSFFGSHETQYGGGLGGNSCYGCGETSHIAALNPWSSSTLVRIVFDASCAQRGSPA